MRTDMTIDDLVSYFLRAFVTFCPIVSPEKHVTMKVNRSCVDVQDCRWVGDD